MRPRIKLAFKIIIPRVDHYISGSYHISLALLNEAGVRASPLETNAAF
jgi:hypothetical protein